MKIAVIGAGAIGGYVGGKLALAGEEVTFIARGANLEAIRARGIKLETADGREHVARDVKAITDYAAAGPQDIAILATRAHQLDAVADHLPLLFGKSTTVVTMQDGIPFWYFHEHGGDLAGTIVRSVDPGGRLAAKIPPERIVGCVAYPTSQLVAPGVVRHVEGARLALGELDGTVSSRVTRISERFVRAGFKAPVLKNIRAEIWFKLWGSLAFSPISALSRSTIADICQYSPTRELAAAMMNEAQLIAAKLGVRFRIGLDKRIATAEKVDQHEILMLRDLEAGRTREIEALVGSVVELGRLTSTYTPHINSVYAVARLLVRSSARDVQEPDAMECSA
jgi:2-dehydropantoate 2-reductase